MSGVPKGLIHYVDGCGNDFTIGVVAGNRTAGDDASATPLIIVSYDPMTPDRSSSLTYSGGESVDDVIIPLNRGGDAALGMYESLRRTITALAQAADHPDVCTTRSMGTGTVVARPLTGDLFDAEDDLTAEDLEASHFPLFIRFGSPTLDEVTMTLRQLLTLANAASSVPTAPSGLAPRRPPPATHRNPDGSNAAGASTDSTALRVAPKPFSNR